MYFFCTVSTTMTQNSKRPRRLDPKRYRYTIDLSLQQVEQLNAIRDATEQTAVAVIRQALRQMFRIRQAVGPDGTVTVSRPDHPDRILDLEQ
jgi:hypothetical protein